MGKNKLIGKDFVKKETLVIVAFISLAVGFLAGNIYNSGPKSGGEPVANDPHKSSGQGEGLPAVDVSGILALEARVASNPKDVDAWTELGDKYFDTNQFEKSIEAYKKSLGLRPNNPDVLTDMGVMYRRVHKYDKAVESFNKAMSIDPNHEISRMNKGIVLFYDLKDKEGAIKAWEDLLKRNPSVKMPEGELLSDFIIKLKGKK